MTVVRDATCGLEFTVEEAEALGAEKVVRGGRAHWFCCPTCRKEWEAKHPE